MKFFSFFLLSYANEQLQSEMDLSVHENYIIESPHQNNHTHYECVLDVHVTVECTKRIDRESIPIEPMSCHLV